MRKVLILVGLAVLVGAAWAAEFAPPGTVKVATPGMVVTIEVPKPGSKKPIEAALPFGKDALLPGGKYHVATVQLYKPDDKGKMWILNAAKDLGSLQTLDVAPGQTATVQGGEALKIRTRVAVTKEKPPMTAGCAKAGPPPKPIRVVTVYLDYIGKSGEHYGPKAIIGQAPIQTRPVIRIKDEYGKLLAEGPYAFGSSGFGGFG
jgi:hypothetical protein